VICKREQFLLFLHYFVIPHSLCSCTARTFASVLIVYGANVCPFMAAFISLNAEGDPVEFRLSVPVTGMYRLVLPLASG
jgi:hypothetical protein